MNAPSGEHVAASGFDRSTVLFAVTVFVSAFLLFQIQPLISKAILPWFGGTPGVWTACMLFFQMGLFGGYAYAHLLTSRVPVRGQVGLHVALIATAVALLQVLPEASWKPAGDQPPALRIVLLLGATVGLPYFLLATTGPLLQRWFSLIHPTRSPYRLYALSNVGSLLALLSYPFVVEPLLKLPSQAHGWAIGFWVFAVLCVGCGLRLRKADRATTSDALSSRGGSSVMVASDAPTDVRSPSDGPRPPTLGGYALWFVLAMLASTMYLATTNQVCQDVAVVPFLWVLPLSLYLLSFILCFESDKWYRRRWWAFATGALTIGICVLMLFGSDVSLSVQIGVYFGAMFAICMICHGELARLRPDPRHLTAFYLTLSAGGAGGGVVVAVIAPQVFPDFWELPLSLLAVSVCVAMILFDDLAMQRTSARFALMPTVVGIVLFVAVGTVFVESVINYGESMAMTRNFYGVLEVEHDDVDNSVVLRHGQIIHGLQLRSSGLQQVPTTYYVRRSGVGRALELMQSRKDALRIGLVGLGVGTLAAYGRSGDVFRFYEINADIDRLARSHFSFMEASRAEVETILGDARLSLAAEPPQQFNVLVLDAFAGDAIPTHLLTYEAFTEYLRHMSEDGIIAVHISNLHFNLRPVTDALADALDLHTVTIIVPEVQSPVDPSSEWVLMARDPVVLNAEPLRHDVAAEQPSRVLWTDDYSNLFRVLR